MAERASKSYGQIRLENRSASTKRYAGVIHGDCTTRATVLAQFDAIYPNAPVGSLYLSAAGKLYLKVNTAGAATDWELVTTTAAD